MRVCVIVSLGKFCEGVSVHISGVLERLAVILGVLSVSKHGTIAWCQWFCALRSSKNHHTHPYHFFVTCSPLLTFP